VGVKLGLWAAEASLAATYANAACAGAFIATGGGVTAACGKMKLREIEVANQRGEALIAETLLTKRRLLAELRSMKSLTAQLRQPAEDHKNEIQRMHRFFRVHLPRQQSDAALIRFNDDTAQTALDVVRSANAVFDTLRNTLMQVTIGDQEPEQSSRLTRLAKETVATMATTAAAAKGKAVTMLATTAAVTLVACTATAAIRKMSNSSEMEMHSVNE
jgi:hypothetical protein